MAKTFQQFPKDDNINKIVDSINELSLDNKEHKKQPTPLEQGETFMCTGGKCLSVNGYNHDYDLIKIGPDGTIKLKFTYEDEEEVNVTTTGGDSPMEVE